MILTSLTASARFSSNLAAVIVFHKILSLVIIVLLLFMLEHFFGVGWALEQTVGWLINKIFDNYLIVKNNFLTDNSVKHTVW